MTSNVFVRPETGSHAEGTHWEQCAFSDYKIINTVGLSSRGSICLPPPKYHNFLHWGGLSGKEDWYQKREVQLREKRPLPEQDALADFEQVRWR